MNKYTISFLTFGQIIKKDLVGIKETWLPDEIVVGDLYAKQIANKVFEKVKNNIYKKSILELSKIS